VLVQQAAAEAVEVAAPVVPVLLVLVLLELLWQRYFCSRESTYS
jgi:hypothetical protein